MQADLRLCWSYIPHCWKSHAAAQMVDMVKEAPKKLLWEIRVFIKDILSEINGLSASNIQ